MCWRYIMGFKDWGYFFIDRVEARVIDMGGDDLLESCLMANKEIEDMSDKEIEDMLKRWDKWKPRLGGLIRIGFWYDVHPDNIGYPKVNDFVDNNWDSESKQKVVAHLKKSFSVGAYMGHSECRICGCANGSADHTDGHFLFPEGLLHYVEKHNVRMEELEQFIARQ